MLTHRRWKDAIVRVEYDDHGFEFCSQYKVVNNIGGGVEGQVACCLCDSGSAL